MTAGLKTTCGSRMLSNFTAPYDAFVVEGLRRAGTVLIGKTNMDEFAMGSSNETSYYGAVKNPWNTEYVPGGSSRIRRRGRRAWCRRHRHRHGRLDSPARVASGICGMKPTMACSRYGLVAFASSPTRPEFRAHGEDCGPAGTRWRVMTRAIPRRRPAARGLHARLWNRWRIASASPPNISAAGPTPMSPRPSRPHSPSFASWARRPRHRAAE